MESTRISCIVMAKKPEPGRVKTRLVPRLGEEGAAALAEAMLGDTLDRIWEANLSGWLYLDAGDGELPEEVGAFPVRRQKGRSLGERVANAVVERWTAGDEGVIVLGMDAPNFPDWLFLKAVDHLQSGLPSVLGPTLDGGVYLLGFRDVAGSHGEALRQKLAALPWETDEIGAALREALEPPFGPPLMLDVWYDVDEPADLDRLDRDLRDPTSAGRYAEQTARWLRQRGRVL